MVGDFLGAVVGHVADDHAVPSRGLDVDVVVADPGPDHAPAARRTRETRLAHDRDIVKQQDRVGLRQIIGQLRLVPGPRHDESRDVVENRRLDRGLVKEIGDQHRESIISSQNGFARWRHRDRTSGQ